MQTLDLKGTELTPTILLDKKNGVFEISGRSIPENAAEFYAPALEWIKAYAQKANPTTELGFKLEYYNTGSSKIIYDLLMALQQIEGARVLWYFHDEDEDMEEAGQEFAELVDIPFEFKVY